MTTNTPTPQSSQQQPTQQPAPSTTLRSVLIVVGSLVLALVLLFTVIRVVHSMNSDPGRDASGTTTVTDAFDSIDLRSTATDIDISYGDVTRAELRFEQGGTDMRLEHRVSGDDLRVTIKRNGWWGWGIGDFGPREGARLQVVLPASLQGDDLDLDVETTAGNLTIDGDYGDVALESTAGAVKLTGSADDLKIETTAGDVDLNDFAVSGTFSSDSTAGDSRLDFRTLPERIDVQTTAGEVTVTLPDGRYRIETDTTGGEVRQHVSSDANSDRVYRFESTAGDIELNER